MKAAAWRFTKSAVLVNHYGRAFSEVLGRSIRHRDTLTSEWSEKLRAAGLPEHIAHRLTVMRQLHKQWRYERMNDDYHKLTGEDRCRRK